MFTNVASPASKALVLVCTSVMLAHAAAPTCVVSKPLRNEIAGDSQSKAVVAQDSVLVAWRHKVSQAKVRPVNIVVLGDSIACCFGPTDYENIWTNVLRQAEALRYGNHGTGIIPIGNDFGLSTNPQWSLHPQGGNIDTVPFGPYQGAKGAFGGVFRLKGAAQVTVLLPVKPPDGVTLYYASAADSKAGIRVSYDDRSSITVGQLASTTLKAQRVNLPSDKIGSSTLSFSAASDSGCAYIYGVEFTYGKTGISLHNLAHGYARSEAWGADPEAQLAFLSQIRGGIQLAILSLGVNDSINGTGTTADEYREHMATIINHLRTLDPAMPIVIFDEIPTRLGESATILPQSAIRVQERLLASQFAVGYISPYEAFGPPAAAADRGYFSKDNLHPSDLGNRRIADVIQQYLKSSTLDRVLPVAGEN
ncbi:MAG: SGNH/GDSL hydrolase family protein [Terracidiphilus sp.]